MLVKGKRTFESFVNSIAHHLAGADDNWQPEETVEEPSIIFGVEGEWSGLLAIDGKGHVHGIELENDTYSQPELLVVEKAISLLEGIKWSDEIASDVKSPRGKKTSSAKNGVRIVEDDDGADEGEE